VATLVIRPAKLRICNAAFDGITAQPKELVGVNEFPLITKALLARGYSKKDVKKILGGNFLRVFKANQQ
jgi:membrane dipeptidase